MTNSTPSKAISVRIKALTRGKASGQRRHDLRIGYQPKYVDQARSHLNRVLIEPPATADLAQRTVDRREAGRIPDPGKKQRALRSNAAVATMGIITFGRAAQEIIRAAPIADQDAAYRAVAGALADRYGVDVLGLVVHEDEEAPHAHIFFDARTTSGESFAREMRGSEVQDLAAAAIREHFPTIERGVRRSVRVARGEGRNRTTNRTVRELHRDREREVAALSIQAEALREDIRSSIAHKAALDRASEPTPSNLVAQITGRPTKLQAANAADRAQLDRERERLEADTAAFQQDKRRAAAEIEERQARSAAALAAAENAELDRLALAQAAILTGTASPKPENGAWDPHDQARWDRDYAPTLTPPIPRPWPEIVWAGLISFANMILNPLRGHDRETEGRA